MKPVKPEVVATANGSMQVNKMTTITWLLQGAEFFADFLLLYLGSCGVVLGFQWLLTLGDIKLNFRKVTMELWYKGKKYVLKGAGNQVWIPGAGKLAKLLENQSQLCMIQVVPQGSEEFIWHPSKSNKIQEDDPAFLEVLSEFLHYLKIL